MYTPNILSLEDLLEQDGKGNSKMKLISQCIAVLSAEFLDSLNLSSPDAEEYVSLVLAEVTKHVFEYLLSMPLNHKQADEIKKQILQEKFSQLIQEPPLDTELKH